MVEVVRVFVYLSAFPDDVLTVNVDVSLCFLLVQFDTVFSVIGIFDSAKTKHDIKCNKIQGW